MSSDPEPRPSYLFDETSDLESNVNEREAFLEEVQLCDFDVTHHISDLTSALESRHLCSSDLGPMTTE